ncbi:MAG: hypothetical protein ACAH80_09495 [Alphaproteobacteria bacterium]
MAGDSDKTKLFQAVASYTLGKGIKRDMLLTDYRAVVSELATGSRAPFFMGDIADYMNEHPDPDPDSDADKPLQALQGLHVDKFRVSIVMAEDGGKRVFLPVCEDMHNGRLLVVGPGGGNYGGAPVEKLVYVDGSSSTAVEAINSFIDKGILERGAVGIKPASAHKINQHLVQAISLVADLSSLTEEINMAPKGQSPEMVPMLSGTTLGKCFQAVAAGQADVDTCIIARPHFNPEEADAQVMQGVTSDIKVGKPFSFKPKA